MAICKDNSERKKNVQIGKFDKKTNKKKKHDNKGKNITENSETQQ